MNKLSQSANGMSRSKGRILILGKVKQLLAERHGFLIRWWTQFMSGTSPIYCLRKPQNSKYNHRIEDHFKALEHVYDVGFAKRYVANARRSSTLDAYWSQDIV